MYNSLNNVTLLAYTISVANNLYHNTLLKLLCNIV